MEKNEILRKMLERPPNMYVQAGLITHEEYAKILSMIICKEDEMAKLGVILIQDVQNRYWDLKQGNLFDGTE